MMSIQTENRLDFVCGETYGNDVLSNRPQRALFWAVQKNFSVLWQMLEEVPAHDALTTDRNEFDLL
jgi:hypothetical protein